MKDCVIEYGSMGNAPRRMRRHLSILLILIASSSAVLLGGCHWPTCCNSETDDAGPSLHRHSYTTTFPRTEDPLSEEGNWIGGSASGTRPRIGGRLWLPQHLWGDVQTRPGFVHGIERPTEFGDPTAIVAGHGDQSKPLRLGYGS